MIRSSNSFLRLLTSLQSFLAVCVSLAGCYRTPTQEVEPKISFTQVPQWDTGNRNEQDVMEGKVRGAQPGQRMVLYSKCGGLWWLQPLLKSPYTAILSDTQWRNEMHLGTEYAALLVDPLYHPSAVLRELPKRGGSIAQVAVARGQKKSSSFFVDFSGFTWRVRWKPSDRGGISNPYEPDNVYKDAAGALHLRIIKRNQRWTCSEVNLTRSLGYGTYTFTVEDTSQLDPAAVFGIFTWDYSTDEQNNREFDINFTRWGERDNKNAEYVLQPSIVPSNVSRFIAPAGKLEQTIVWESGRVIMTTARAAASPGEPPVFKRVFTSEVPSPGSESIRMTFYVYSNKKRRAFDMQTGAEVIVDRFQYRP